MKFTLSWLKKHLDTTASLDEIVNAMVKIGLEVEEVHSPADRLGAITVGHVLAAEKHPDADKLKVCRVATTDGEQQIVCGAPNAREGINVAFAPVGTYIPGIDVTLSKAKIRGVESFGMMCSVRELELGDDHDGIMELSADAVVGDRLVDVLGLDDPVIDFEVTPNRPDTNGVDGVARDLAAAGVGSLVTPAAPALQCEGAQTVPVEIDAPEACPAFASRLIRGVKNGPSPQWLQDQLRAIGLRPINALVDVTNYLSYDRARPLHVYDVAKLSGTVRARMGKSGEEFLALDGKTYRVDETMCVIADDAQVLGLGGVMGGETSGCTEETTDVLIECALFDAMLIAKTGRKTGIVSDARYRFERGVDPASVEPGLALATQMIVEMCGGTPSEAEIAGTIPTPQHTIDFPPAEVTRLTGIDVPDSEKERILTDLGFVVQRGGTWTVTAPPARPDIEGKADLVEEIARIYGLDNLPAQGLRLVPGATRPQRALSDQRNSLARDAMTSLGYHETVTWAFCDGALAETFGGNTALRLSNPIASDLNTMRPNALPNLLQAVSRNVARGASHVALFEIGGAYSTDAPNGQNNVLSAVIYGTPAAEWRSANEPYDVYDAKAATLSCLKAIGAPVANLSTFAAGPDIFHPGRRGNLGLGPKNILAEFGEIHPALVRDMGLPGPVMALNIFMDKIPAPKAKGGKTKAALNASNLMPVARSFAFVVDKSVEAEKLLKAVRGADKSTITDVRLFDVYEGKGIDETQKSLAVEVILQPKEKTFTDEEIEAISSRIVSQAEKAAGAVLRS